MSGEDSVRNFLLRWSQRKRTSVSRAADDAESGPQEKAADTNAVAPVEADLPIFDPASLPPIESITATSDIRAFLAPGVPEELTRAALRRVWVTDPTIRDFIGIAENQWDFTKPDSIPGFGSLELTPELRRMVASLIGDAPVHATPQPENTTGAEQIAENSAQKRPAARALARGEDDRSAERSSVHSGLAPTADAAAPVRAMPQDDKNESVEKGPGNADEVHRSLPRRHGGAVPK